MRSRRLRIAVVTPAPPRSRHGNRITALRYARLLRELGHDAHVATDWRGRPTDVLVALHARRSHPAIRRFRAAHPEGALVVTLTGTDVYGDLRRSARARDSLELATRLLALQPLALRRLPARVRRKARVILQSAAPRRRTASRAAGGLRVAVIGHLRPVKDPFRAALASRRLPRSSGVRILHLGGALSPAMERRARAEEGRNPRYRWLGSVPHGRALAVLARSDLLVQASRNEGGANVVAEALVTGVPVLASRAPGNVGMLGSRHPGLFDVGDTAGLARLLRRAEEDARFYARLVAAGSRRASRFHPEHERRAWARLLKEVAPRAV